MFGDSAPVAPKRNVAAAIAAGEGPSALHVGNDRFARERPRCTSGRLSTSRRQSSPPGGNVR